VLAVVLLLLSCVNLGLVSSADPSAFNALMSRMSSLNLSAVEPDVGSPLYSGSVYVYVSTSCSDASPSYVAWSVSGKTVACGETCFLIANPPPYSLKVWCGQSSSQTTFQSYLWDTSRTCSGSPDLTLLAIGNRGSGQCITGTGSYQGTTIDIGFKVNCGTNSQPPANSISNMCGGGGGEGDSNLPMIIGIVIAVGVVVIAGIVLYCYCRRRSSQQQSAPVSSPQSTGSINYQPNYQPNNNQTSYPSSTPGYINPTQNVVWGNPRNPTAYNRM